MSGEKTPAQLLREGADYIAEHGLRQDGSFGTIDGPCCVLGAMGVVDARDPFAFQFAFSSSDPIQVAATALDATEPGQDITLWNDAPGRTADEVIAKMREVAAHLDAQAVAS